MSATKTDIPSPSEILEMRDAYNKKQLARQIVFDKIKYEDNELRDLYRTLLNSKQIQESTPQEITDNDKRTIEYYTRSHIFLNDHRAMNFAFRDSIKEPMLMPHFLM